MAPQHHGTPKLTLFESWPTCGDCLYIPLLQTDTHILITTTIRKSNKHHLTTNTYHISLLKLQFTYIIISVHTVELQFQPSRPTI